MSNEKACPSVSPSLVAYALDGLDDVESNWLCELDEGHRGAHGAFVPVEGEYDAPGARPVYWEDVTQVVEP